jgi:PAS domain-containing protein
MEILERSYIPSAVGYIKELTSYLDVTIKKKHEKLKKKREARIMKHEGLLEVDKSERITLLNQSFCEISGYTEDELIGKKVNELLVAVEREVLEERSATEKRDKYSMNLLL